MKVPARIKPLLKKIYNHRPSLVLQQRKKAHKLLKTNNIEDILKLDYSYLDGLAHTNKRKFLELKQKIETENIKKISEKDKVNVIFVLYTSSMWSCEQIYKNLSKDKRFNTTVVVADFKDGTKETRDKNYNSTLDYFKNNGFEVVGARDSAKLTSVIDKADVVFYLTPFPFIQKETNLLSLPLSKLPIYITYSFMLADRKEKFNLPMYYLTWKFFADTSLYKEMMREKSISSDSNVMFFGFSRMDEFLEKCKEKESNIWKIPSKNSSRKTYKIIYAPHHSVFDKTAGFSTFDQNYDFILKLAKKYKDNTTWIVKPHPLLRDRIVKNGFFKSYKEYDDYLKEWDSQPNARVVTSGTYFDMFKTSDAMILDSASFLAEYQYVHKPLLFLTRKTQRFNEFGNRLKEVLYCADGDDFDGIEKFFNEVVFNSKDTMKEKREEFFKNYLDYYAKNGNLSASDAIHNFLVNTFSKKDTK